MVLDLAFQYHRHADFHLDYNLDLSTEPLIWYLLDELLKRVTTGRWHDDSCICVGHATRLVLFTDDEWSRYNKLVHDNHLPVTLVGLPQSDLYMMGRDLEPAPRGTLNVVRSERKHGIQVAMAVNNVQNAFTPQGPPDPLALCSLGVAIFQAATPADCHCLVVRLVGTNTTLLTLAFFKTAVRHYHGSTGDWAWCIPSCRSRPPRRRAGTSRWRYSQFCRVERKQQPAGYRMRSLLRSYNRERRPSCR